MWGSIIVSVTNVKSYMKRIVLLVLVWRSALAQLAELDGNEVLCCYSVNNTARFSCTVNDPWHHEGTVWSGTAFNCPTSNSITNNRIYLPHSLFNTRAVGTCNGGTITGESAGVNGSSYTSTLTVSPVTLDMNGQTISCSLSGSTLHAGIRTLYVGAVPEPPPSMSLSFPIPSQVFTVAWTKPLTIIGGVGGFLTNTSGDCGQCSDLGMVGPNTTEVSCSGWEPTGQTCNITVHTVTADCQFQSVEPALATVYLKLPTISMHMDTMVLATYALDGSLLFTEAVLSYNQNVTDDNGLPIMTIIVYTHSSGNESTEIVLNCHTKISCTHIFETDHVGGEYFVKVGAQTPVGKVIQPDSEALTVGTVNTFVHIAVDVLQSYTIINCDFFSKYDYLSCRVEYDQDCDSSSYGKEIRSVSNGFNVSVLLPDITPSTMYCFTVTADNQSHTVRVQGSFRGYAEYKAESSTLLVSTIIVMSVTVVMALVSLTALTASVIICWKRPRSKDAAGEAGGGDHVTIDPTYEEVSAVKTNDNKIDTEPNEAYHPVSVELNEAYQINASITAS